MSYPRIVYKTDYGDWLSGVLVESGSGDVGLIGRNVPAIVKVIYHDPATIVYWGDGSKTVVKVSEHDAYSPMAGLLACIVKKLCGDVGSWHQLLKQWLPKDGDTE